MTPEIKKRAAEICGFEIQPYVEFPDVLSVVGKGLGRTHLDKWLTTEEHAWMVVDALLEKGFDIDLESNSHPKYKKWECLIYNPKDEEPIYKNTDTRLSALLSAIEEVLGDE